MEGSSAMKRVFLVLALSVFWLTPGFFLASLFLAPAFADDLATQNSGQEKQEKNGQAEKKQNASCSRFRTLTRVHTLVREN